MVMRIAELRPGARARVVGLGLEVELLRVGIGSVSVRRRVAPRAFVVDGREVRFERHRVETVSLGTLVEGEVDHG